MVAVVFDRALLLAACVLEVIVISFGLLVDVPKDGSQRTRR